MIASEDGSGVWTVQIVKINPQVSVNSVHTGTYWMYKETLRLMA